MPFAFSTELLKSHPDLTAAHFTLGNIYANEKRYREAADEYQEVTRRNPADMVALLAQVKALVNVSAFTEARAPGPGLRAQETERSVGARPARHGVPGIGRLRQGRAGT